MAYGSIITDNVMNVSLDKVIACYDNFQILDQFMPEFHDLRYIKKVTDSKGCMYGKQYFPWPMATRDMLFHVTGFFDYKNKAVTSVSKSIDPGEKYYDYVVQDATDGLVRLRVKMGYNYFQYLGPNKTRHMAIWNTDPQIDYIPTMFLNYTMTNVLYTLMINLETFSKKLETPEGLPDLYQYYERKIPYYDSFMD